ncbi:MAG: hypothetical protein ACERKN_22275 [Velocimicrobium sp.]
MKKATRLALLFILLCGSFFIGYIVSVNDNQLNKTYENKNKTDNISNSESSTDDTTTHKPLPTTETKKLSKEEQNFLEEHVYGYWKISRRIVALDESNNDTANLSSNISDEGVKSLIGSGIRINKKSISQEASRISAVAHLTNPADTYLLGLYGIFNKIVNPVYEISEVNTKDLLINNKLVNIKSPLDIFGTERITKVSYGLGELDYSSTFINIEIYEIGGTLYVPDTTDKNTLYIDFCGIWELKRSEDPSKGTNGKSIYGF